MWRLVTACLASAISLGTLALGPSAPTTSELPRDGGKTVHYVSGEGYVSLNPAWLVGLEDEVAATGHFTFMVDGDDYTIYIDDALALPGQKVLAWTSTSDTSCLPVNRYLTFPKPDDGQEVQVIVLRDLGPIPCGAMASAGTITYWR